MPSQWVCFSSTTESVRSQQLVHADHLTLTLSEFQTVGLVTLATTLGHSLTLLASAVVIRVQL